MASSRTAELELAHFPEHSVASLDHASASEVESQQNEQRQPSSEGFSLPPTDGGKDAWLFLFCCFMLEGLIWGFAASYGIFQEYYSTHAPFAGQSNIAVVGACAMGIMYMAVVPMFALLKYFPRLRAWGTPVGLVIMCLSLGLGSLSNTVTHLIISQGIMYSIGGALAWTPILFYIEEWWVRRRGFAYGATVAGLGLSGAILPIVLQWLLERYGFRTALRVCALTFVVLNFPLLFFFKPRLPLSQAVQARGFDLSFLRCTTFLIQQSVVVLQGLGYFLPAIYLPTYAQSLGASGLQSTATIMLLNFAAFVGCLLMGTAVDRWDVTYCLSFTAMGSAVAVFLLWGFATSLPVLYLFCVMYGAFAGCNSSSWSAVMRDTKSKKERADMGMIFAFLSAGKGLANVCSGPLSEVLLQAGNWKAGMAYGSSYGAVIAFTGATAFFSGWGLAAKRLGWL